MTTVEKHLPGAHDQKSHGRRSLSRLAGLGSLARTLSPKTNGQPFAIPTEPITASVEEVGNNTYRFTYGDMQWERKTYADTDERWAGESYDDWATWSGNWAMRMASASLMGQTLPAAIGDEYLDDDLRELLITGKVRHTPEGPDGQVIEVRDRSLLGTSQLAIQDAQRYIEEAEWGLQSVYWGFPSYSDSGPGARLPVYRGISVDKDDPVLRLTPGDEFIMPLSAFTPNKRTAESFTDHGDDTTVGSDVRVVFRLPVGTRGASAPTGFEDEIEVNGEWVTTPIEFVTAGRFAVDTIQWHGHDKVTINLRQTAAFDPTPTNPAHQWQEIHKADLGMPEWVWKLSGSFGTSEISKRRVVVPPYIKADGTHVDGYTYERKGAALKPLTPGDFRRKLAEVLPGLKGSLTERVASGDPESTGYTIDKRKIPVIRAHEDVGMFEHERAVVLDQFTELAKQYPETAKQIISIDFVSEDSIQAAASTGLNQVTDNPWFEDEKTTRSGIHFNFAVDSMRTWPNPNTVNSFWPKQPKQMSLAEAQQVRGEGEAYFDNVEDADAHIRELIVHEWTHARHFTTLAQRLAPHADGPDGMSPLQRAFLMLRRDREMLNGLLDGKDFFAVDPTTTDDYDTFRAVQSKLQNVDMGGLPTLGLMAEAKHVSEYATRNVAEAVAEAGTLEYVLPNAKGFRQRMVPKLTESVHSLAKSAPTVEVLPDGSVGIRCHLGCGSSEVSKHLPGLHDQRVHGRRFRNELEDVTLGAPIGKADLTPEFNGDVLDSLGEFADATRITGNLSRAQREAVRVQMRRAMARGEDLTKATARIKRLHLGLSPRDSLALDNYRESLRKQGFPEARVERQVRAYSKRLQAKRNALIASQEIAIAYGDAKRAEWTKAQDAGVLSDQAMRVYHCHPDERTCEVCRPLDGTKRKLDDPVAPPMHVGCRCWETIEDPGAKRGMLKQAKVQRPYRGNQHHRVTELVLTDKARALLRAQEKDTEGITNWGAFAPPRSPIGKKKVVVPPYVKADGTKVEGYSYERKGKKARRWSRSRRPVDRRVRDYTGKPDDWVQPEEFSWTRANIDLGTGTSPLPRDRAAIKRKVNKDLTKSLMIRSETDAVLHDSLDLLAEGLMANEIPGHDRQWYGHDAEQNRYEVSKKIVRAVIDGWASSSWKTAESTAFQKAVARRFDAPGIKAVAEVRDGFSEHVVGDAKNRKLGWNKESDSAITAEILNNVELLHDGNYSGANKWTVTAMNVVMDALVDAVYENTQKVLDDQKVEELHLHRGTSAQYVEEPSANKTVKLEGKTYDNFVDLIELATDSFLIAQEAYNAHQNKMREIEFYLWTNEGENRHSSDEQEKFMGPLAHENIKLITDVDIPLDDRRVLTIGVTHWWISDMLSSSYVGAGDMRKLAWRLIDQPALVNNEDTFDVQARDVNMFVKAMIPRVEPNAGTLAEHDRFTGKNMTAGWKMYQMFTGRDEPWTGASANWGMTLMDDENLAATIAFEYTQNAPGVREHIDKLWADMHTTLVETVGEEGMDELRKLRVMEIDEDLLRNNAEVKHLISQDTDDDVISEIRKLVRGLGADISGNNVDDILISIRNGTAGSIPGGGKFAVDYLRENAGSVEFTLPGATSLGAVLQPASAFSTDQGVAKRFGPMMLNAVVPKERILSTAMTGPGCLNEDEILVIGGETDLSVTAPVRGYGTAKMVVKADPRIWPDLDEADWIKAVGDDTIDY